jgi:hypothetical protein
MIALYIVVMMSVKSEWLDTIILGERLWRYEWFVFLALALILVTQVGVIHLADRVLLNVLLHLRIPLTLSDVIVHDDIVPIDAEPIRVVVPIIWWVVQAIVLLLLLLLWWLILGYLHLLLLLLSWLVIVTICVLLPIRVDSLQPSGALQVLQILNYPLGCNW